MFRLKQNHWLQQAWASSNKSKHVLLWGKSSLSCQQKHEHSALRNSSVSESMSESLGTCLSQSVLPGTEQAGNITHYLIQEALSVNSLKIQLCGRFVTARFISILSSSNLPYRDKETNWTELFNLLVFDNGIYSPVNIWSLSNNYLSDSALVEQWCMLSRCISWVNPKIIYWYDTKCNL